jgi:hypothetical protein
MHGLCTKDIKLVRISLFRNLSSSLCLRDQKGSYNLQTNEL